MKSIRKRNVSTVRAVMSVIAVVFAVAIAASFSIGTSHADTNLECEYLSGRNIEGQNYSRWTSPRTSYLTKISTGYMRVQNTSDGIKIVKYDSSFNVKSRETLPQELPIFGAFYETSSNYYIVSGQTNTSEDDSVQVYRVTKYDKDWNRIGSCGLNGANTTVPFDAGSCRIDHTGKYMVIRTCHKMYKSPNDGLNHQANVTMLVDTDQMSVIDSATTVSGAYYGYVSHSFNQFVKLENNKIVSLDHGDAYPRSMLLMKYPTDVTTGSLRSGSVTPIDIISFPGSIGNNTTGASAGGLEISSSSYLVAGNSVVQDDQNTSRSTRNVFVAAVNKSTDSVTMNWITEYSEGEASTRTPHLVKLGTDSFMLLWSRESKVYYTLINGSGEKVGDIHSMDGSGYLKSENLLCKAKSNEKVNKVHT